MPYTYALVISQLKECERPKYYTPVLQELASYPSLGTRIPGARGMKLTDAQHLPMRPLEGEGKHHDSMKQDTQYSGCM